MEGEGSDRDPMNGLVTPTAPGPSSKEIHIDSELVTILANRSRRRLRELQSSCRVAARMDRARQIEIAPLCTEESVPVQDPSALTSPMLQSIAHACSATFRVQSSAITILGLKRFVRNAAEQLRQFLAVPQSYSLPEKASKEEKAEPNRSENELAGMDLMLVRRSLLMPVQVQFIMVISETFMSLNVFTVTFEPRAAEKITLDWGYMQLVKAGDFLLHGDDSLSTAAAGGSLVLDRQPKRQRIEPPTGLLMIGLQCQQQLYVSCVSAGTFLFDCFSEHGLHLAHFAVDDGGRIYGKDFRLWKSYRFTVLDDLSFPTVQLPLPRVSTEHSTHLGPHPGGPHGGIGAFAIDYVLRSLFRQAYGDSTGPWRIDALWMAPDYTIEGFPQHIPPHNGEIVAPLAFDGHWAPLYGLDSPSGWQWFYLDGVADRLTLAMCVFATQLTDLLGVPFLGMKHRRLYHQEDLSSCGTIVIAHTMAILGLAGEFLNDDILRLHAWLRHHFAFMDDQLAGGPSSDSSGLQGELAQLLATKGVPAGVAFERAGDAITALGADKLSAATRAKNQWQALKGVSSQSKKPFKFVLAWELQAHIEKRAKEKHGAHLPRDRKKERKADDIPAVPDPGFGMWKEIRDFTHRSQQNLPEWSLSTVDTQEVCPAAWPGVVTAPTSWPLQIPVGSNFGGHRQSSFYSVENFEPQLQAETQSPKSRMRRRRAAESSSKAVVFCAGFLVPRLEHLLQQRPGLAALAAMPPKAVLTSLRTERGLEELNTLLASQSYVGGTFHATAEETLGYRIPHCGKAPADMTCFAAVHARPDRQQYPHLHRWYNHISSLKKTYAPYHVWAGQTKQVSNDGGQEVKKAGVATLMFYQDSNSAAGPACGGKGEKDTTV
eukprot:g7420.t2